MFKNNYSQEINIFPLSYNKVAICHIVVSVYILPSYVSDTCILNCIARISNSTVQPSFQNMKTFYCKGNYGMGSHIRNCSNAFSAIWTFKSYLWFVMHQHTCMNRFSICENEIYLKQLTKLK